METIKLLRKLAQRFPKSIKSHGDRIGLMTGKLPGNVNNILLCLDFDDIVLAEVKKMAKKPDMILTHHPFIYGPRGRVLKRDLVKAHTVEEIDKLGIPVYSMHTNFDTGKDGMNDALSEALLLSDIKPLEKAPMARGGKLPHKMEIHEFAKYANEKLHMPYSELIHAGKDEIERVAIIGGAGSRYFEVAMLEGYDIFISGDIPHHARRDIIARHYNYLNMFHEIERIFIPQMKKLLLEIDPSLNVTTIDHEEVPELIK